MDYNSFDLETYLIIGGVLELIILICFFVLCNNVSIIKKKLSYDDKPISIVVATLLAAGQKEKARTVMTEFLINRISSLPGIHPDSQDIQNIVKQHELILKSLDMNFDVSVYINSRDNFYK